MGKVSGIFSTEENISIESDTTFPPENRAGFLDPE
jgi:hypothetical protein